MAVSWSDVANYSVVTAVVTTVLNQAANRGFDWWKTRSAAKYLAIRLVVILEHFALECANLISDYRLIQDSNGVWGKYSGHLPQLAEFPEDADWGSLDQDLVAKVLALPAELTFSEVSIRDMDMTSGPAAAHEQAAIQAGKRGMGAWEHAVDLRKKYDLSASTLTGRAWNFVDELVKQNERQREFEEKQRAMVDKMFGIGSATDSD